MASLGDLDRGRDPALSLAVVLEDLEQQALGLALEERDDAVRDLAEAAYAEVSLHARLHAAVGMRLRLQLAGGWRIEGELDRVGSDFLVVAAHGRRWLVRTASVGAAEGLPARARATTALPVTARLGFTSVLRGLAGVECTLHAVDGVASTGLPSRVGADFVEFETAAAGRAEVVSLVVPLAAIAAVRSRS